MVATPTACALHWQMGGREAVAEANKATILCLQIVSTLVDSVWGVDTNC